MAIVTTELGPGTLTLGVGPLAVSSQLANGKVVPSENVKTKPARKVLSGEEIPEKTTETFTATFQGTFLQDLEEEAGVVAWSWANRGTEQALTFTPNTDAGTAVVGVIKPVPLQVGDDATEEDMEADFTWRFVDFPTLENAGWAP